MFISSNFANGKIYCSAVVNKILTAWSENKSIKISQRDSVIVEPEEKIYRLWNTNLVSENLETGEVTINITGNDDMSNIYFRYGIKVSSSSWYKLDFDTKELIKC